MMRFEGRAILVTGAGSGIGAEMARLFAEEGAVVFGLDIRPDGVPASCTPVQGDVSVALDVERVIDLILGQTGRIDVLCNNAGAPSTTDVLSCSVEEWDRVFAVNARGVFIGTKCVLPAMLRQGCGVIINTASAAGLVGLPNRAAYCASKGAVISFTKQVAVQYAGTGVRCNCLCPGTVDSPWITRLLDDAEDPATLRTALEARQPLGRLGRPEEIAKAALYLASDDAAFMTGSALIIDGGIGAG